MWLFFMGLSIGSFLNVVIYRLPRGLSVVSPRSRCNKCGHQLPWYENVPVFSWLVLGGKCSKCKTPISARYMVVELLTGGLFLACLARFSWGWELVGALTFVTLLVPLSFIDAELWILPFELTLPGILFGVLLAIPLGADAVKTSVIAAIGCFMLYRTLEWVGWLGFRKEALGAGDKYLLAMVGAFLGWRPLLGILFLSSAQGALFGIFNIVTRGRAGPDQPPAQEPPTQGGPPPEAPTTQVTASNVVPAVAPVLVAPADPKPTFTPDFTKPGLSPLKRLVLLPWTLLLQPIPDDLPDEAETGAPPEWEPGATALPFGPWIALAALEVMLIGPTLVRLLEETPIGLSARMMFGAL